MRAYNPHPCIVPIAHECVHASRVMRAAALLTSDKFGVGRCRVECWLACSIQFFGGRTSGDQRLVLKPHNADTAILVSTAANRSGNGFGDQEDLGACDYVGCVRL